MNFSGLFFHTYSNTSLVFNVDPGTLNGEWILQQIAKSAMLNLIVNINQNGRRNKYVYPAALEEGIFFETVVVEMKALTKIEGYEDEDFFIRITG